MLKIFSRSGLNVKRGRAGVRLCEVMDTEHSQVILELQKSDVYCINCFWVVLALYLLFD
jgi:hypothetical protein